VNWKNHKLIFFIPLLPVLFFFIHNAAYFTQLIFTIDVLILLLIYGALAIMISLVIRFIFRRPADEAYLLSALLMCDFLFYGPLQDHLLKLEQYSWLGNTYFLFASLFLLTALIYYTVRRNKALVPRFLLFMFLFFVISILIDGFVLSRKLSGKNNANALAKQMVSPVITTLPVQPSDRPDIYHLIFDSYSNSPALKEYFNYENDINGYLESKGFFVVDSAISNYRSTPYSIASVFNLQYLKGAEPYQHSNSSNFLLGRKAYINNEWLRFLEKYDYRFSIFSQLEDDRLLTNFGVLGVSKPHSWLRKQTMERIYQNPWLRDKITEPFGKSGKQPAMIRKSMRLFHAYNQKAIEHINSDCAKYAHGYKGPPVFSYTHFMIPHDPYLVDENGNLVDKPQPENADMKGYLDQLKYSNKLIRQIIDCILSDTTRKKLIIIQGDHGYRHYVNAPEVTAFGAIDALYFYDGNYEGIQKTGSLVNTYRIIVNKYFGGNLPMLKSKYFNEQK
jgi:hypothetical protein